MLMLFYFYIEAAQESQDVGNGKGTLINPVLSWIDRIPRGIFEARFSQIAFAEKRFLELRLLKIRSA
jgi:hypothetical protein